MSGEQDDNNRVRDAVWKGMQDSFQVLNITLAVSIVILLYRQRGDPSAELALPVAASIFAAGAILDGLARRRFRSVARQPEIEKLVRDAHELLTKQRLRSPDVPRSPNVGDSSATTTAVSLLGALLCWATGILMVVSPAQPTHSLWPAVVAVLVGEAIYLSCSFEQCAKKAELESLAVAWTEKSAKEPYATLSWSWAYRARQLSAAVQPENTPE